MSKPALFKDIGKRLSDLLTKEFPAEKEEKQVAWKGKTSNGVTLDTSLTANPDGSVLGKFTDNYTWKEYTTSLEINTSRDFKVEVSADEKPLEGLKLSVAANSKGQEHWGNFGFTYKHQNFNTTGSVDYGQPKGVTLKASAVGGTSTGSARVDFGGEVEYLVGNENPQLNTLNSLNTKASYSSSEFDLAAFCRIVPAKEVNDVGLSYFHKVNNDLSVGSEISFDPTNLEKTPKLTLGSQFVVQRDTVLKAKFDTSGSLGLSYSQKLNDYARFTLGANVDTKKLSEKNSSKFGFTFTLNSL